MPAVSQVIVQPTTFCNIDCGYCYLPHRAAKTRMSVETARAAFGEIFASGLCTGPLYVVWHAGEPLTLPIGFYREMVETIAALAPAGLAVRHSLNTNATLVDDAWCAFLAEHDFAVGVSIDGPQRFHDAYRKTRAGAGTFAKTLAGLHRLQAAGLDPYTISVITDRSVGEPDAMYDFFRAEGIDRVCLNFEEIDGIHQESSLAGEDQRRAVDRFLRQLWNRMMADGNELWVREFANMFREILRPAAVPPPNLLVTEYGYLNIDWQGNFSTYSPELLGETRPRHGDFLMGRFGRDGLVEALATPKFAAIKAEVDAGVAACRASCDYFSVCRGGAPSNKLAETGRLDVAETLACRLRVKLVTDIVLEAIENSVEAGAAFGALAGSADDLIVV